MRNILKDKSMAFAIQIVNLHKYPNKRKAYSLSDQILISGTAIGVLQKETECAESNADFIHNIAFTSSTPGDSNRVMLPLPIFTDVTLAVLSG